MREKRILSPSHETVKHLVRLQKEKSYRYLTKTVLVEGKNLLLDLVQRHSPKEVFIIKEHFNLFSKYNPTIISKAIAKKISDVVTPEGCFAEFDLPINSSPSKILTGLILDGVQDPGNVGTLFRTALAFNVRTIFLIEPSCDAWNPKVIRAAKGSQFDLTIIPSSWKDIPTNIPIFVADLVGDYIQTILPKKEWLLVLGNEAKGSKIPPSYSFHQITIPMAGPIESLNVAQAGAILLYALSSFRSP
jgi:TrmH family RNA methyltransferase